MATTTTAAVDEPQAGSERLAHQPALDGVRALAVLAVLLFHAGVPGFDGGYVGVSVFFTLSGFLITSLLITEHRTSGRVDAGAFYARRARRLLPASAVCLTGVVLLSTFGAWDGVAHLRRDVWAAALQVFNWLRLSGSGSYGDLFAKTGGQVSPLEHYWSLAIEEQFYWVWPLAFAGLVRLARRMRWPLLIALAIPTAIAIVIAPVIANVFGPDAAYWSTFARVGEILTGAVAAGIVAHRGAPRWTRLAAPWCIAGIAAAVVFFPSTSGPAYQGWLPLLSIVTAVMLLGLQSGGPVRSSLSCRPLVAIGTISYGVYLYHWPIFTLVDEERVGRGGVVLLALRFALTFAAAIVSYRIIERPVRMHKRATRPTLAAGAALTVLVLVLAFAVPDTSLTFDTGGAAEAIAAIDPDGSTGPITQTGGEAARTADGWKRLELAPPTPSRPVRILVVGDSTAKAAGGGLARWAAANPDLAQVSIDGAAGCGLVKGGTRVFPDGDVEISPFCTEYAEQLVPDQVRHLKPDVVLVMSTAWDVADQRFPGTSTEGPTDPEYRRRINTDFAAFNQAVLDAGSARVVWIAQPTTNPWWASAGSPQASPARNEVLHSTMRKLAAADPDHVAVADLAWWIDAAGRAEDRGFRPDGVHLSPEAAEQLATDWLGPLLLSAALTS